jgi:uncharacterized protein with ParB-like and HNH nuclease domain
MDIKPYDKTIRDLLGSKRQFVIPRFQREYSWDKKNYQEFLEDMIGNLVIKEGKISSSQYFLGTMLFIGNFTEGTEQEIQVVDGQQRLTTITILFSALSDRFMGLGQATLSRQLFTYIMTEDDDGNEVRILKSKTSYPFFSYFIQDKDKNLNPEATTEEEHCIKETYEYFHAQLNEAKLKGLLKRKHGSELVEALSEVDILKALRDQVLNSTFVSISTTDRNQANKIFEILNAKGKRLAHIDLIKNKIFEVLNKVEPADFAEETWKNIKEILSSGKESVGLATFYQHFWSSKYKKVYSNKLYEAFNATIKKSEAEYTEFLNELLRNAKTYMQIVNPKREDYDNRKEYFGVVQSLNCINNYFNVVQVRIALLALFDVKQREIIDLTMLKSTLSYLENFHFAYNAILANRTNRLEKIYSSFAIALRKALAKADARDIIRNKLIVPLDELFPTFESFSAKFVALSFTKKEKAFNVKTKYAINKLNSFYSNTEVFADDGSIEHIISEREGGDALNIGNLILLEGNLNVEAGHKDYSNKCAIYVKSNYAWVKNFISQHKQWDSSMIAQRAIELSEMYYSKILKKELPAVP